MLSFLKRQLSSRKKRHPPQAGTKTASARSKVEETVQETIQETIQSRTSSSSTSLQAWRFPSRYVGSYFPGSAGPVGPFREPECLADGKPHLKTKQPPISQPNPAQPWQKVLSVLF
jgi:hypothetical protein